MCPAFPVHYAQGGPDYLIFSKRGEKGEERTGGKKWGGEGFYFFEAAFIV